MTTQENLLQECVRGAIQEIAVGPDRGRDISRDHARQVMQAILAGRADDVQAAVLLIALRMKRESMQEFQGLFDALAESLTAATAPVDELVCLADPFDGYVRTATVTPFIAPTLAACGVSALMHGVKTVGPKHGVTAHKVYALAGMDCVQPVKFAAQQLADAGCAYVDQSVYAPALYQLQGLRDRIVKRTALTTLERLLIPIRARQKNHLVLGYVHKAYPCIYANIAKQAGFHSILLLKGVEGGLAPALGKPLRRFYFSGALPKDIDAEKELVETQALLMANGVAPRLSGSGDPATECLERGLDTLDGKSGDARDSLTLATAQILFAHNPQMSLAKAVEKVQDCLDNGSARGCFDQMVTGST